MSQARLIELDDNLMAENDRYASRNRALFEARGVFALNLMSSPGAGKTTLLVETIGRLAGSVPIAVIEGDQQTSHDAARIAATGATALQINTGSGCHLDAHMIDHAIAKLAIEDGELLFIENVGNLVCPAGFDLGEGARVVIVSVPEGADKPLKYPNMFAAADLMILSKWDLAPYVSFDADLCIEHAHAVTPRLEVMRLSATTGEGVDRWLEWIRDRRGRCFEGGS
jgi:hydrogenase nickel incorporation protein HypB